MTGKLSQDEVQAFIRANNIARLGCSNNDQPYVVPVNYLYFKNSFICCSLDSQKIEMMRQNPLVCLEIDEIIDFQNWTCVIINGNYEELTDPEALAEARKYFPDSFIKLQSSPTALPPETVRQQEQPAHYRNVVYYKIHVQEMSGRFEKQIV